MSQREPTPTVTGLIGQNMRRIREEHGIVLADVSRAARDLGLTWDPSAISRIETGKRDLNLEEFLALPLVMTLAVNQTVTLVQLLDGLGLVTIMDSFGRGFIGQYVLAMLAEPALAARPDIAPEKVSAIVSRHLHMDKRTAQARRVDTEERSVHRELQAVADELGVHVDDVKQATRELWGKYTMSPYQEREQRLVGSGVDLSQPNKVRTLRGHITRQIMNELREYFETRNKKRKEDDDGTSS
ncbi:helix-turn-helix domain-containing protein [Nonomuraea sp. NPDC050451]|uniref:helix-turn-helix domain-containing protein n=1 Tax=Nonomuraea sp. NPDC050451 TaxID=3364364 RepID=UPI00379DA082